MNASRMISDAEETAATTKEAANQWATKTRSDAAQTLADANAEAERTVNNAQEEADNTLKAARENSLVRNAQALADIEATRPPLCLKKSQRGTPLTVPSCPSYSSSASLPRCHTHRLLPLRLRRSSPRQKIRQWFVRIGPRQSVCRPWTPS